MASTKKSTKKIKSPKPSTKTQSHTQEKDDLSHLSPEAREAMVKYMPYMQEAQRKLLVVLAVFIVTALLGAIFYKQILLFVMSRFDLTGINMVLTSPFQVIELAIQTGMYVGMVIAVPMLVYFLLTFLRPALEDHEYKMITSLIPYSILLFIIGFLFGVYIMNYVIMFFTQSTLEFSIGNIWDITQFFSQILFTGIALGIVFQFPIVLTILMRLGIITRKKLVTYRPYVYVGCLIFAAALPPTDIFSLALLVFPLFFLFEIKLLLNKD